MDSLTKNTRGWFIFVIVYLAIDYIRIQDVVPFLRYIKPGMLIILALTLFFIFQGSIKYINARQTRLIAFFILILIAYVPFARNNFLAWTAAKTMLLYIPFIFSVICCVSSIDRLKILIFGLICIMIYISLYSLGHAGRGSGGYFLDENDLSLFINIWLPFCYFLFLLEKRRLMKALYALGFILGIMSVVVSFSRGGFVGLIAMSAVLWYFSPKKMLTLTIVAICALIIFMVGGETYLEEIYTVTDVQEGTADARINSWKSACDMFLDNPLGVGGNNFQARFPEYQDDRFHRGMWGRVAHSIWFTLIPETGILGTLIFLLLLRCNIKDIFTIKRLSSLYNDPGARYLYHVSLAMIASLAGFFASATFLSVLYYPHYWYMTAIIITVVRLAKMKDKITVSEECKTAAHI